MARLTTPRAIVGGFVATVGMSIVMCAAPRMGMPEMDVVVMPGPGVALPDRPPVHQEPSRSRGRGSGH